MFTIALIFVGLGILCVAVMLFWRRKVSPKHEDALMAAEKLKAHLTHIRWYSEMLLQQDFGKLKFSQMEYLHHANQACEQAIEHLQRLLKDAGLEKTGTELKSILKNSQN